MTIKKTAKTIPKTNEQATQVTSDQQPADTNINRAEALKEKCRLKAEYYSKHYPNCREFHITSDMMVFMENDQTTAINHQNSLKKGEINSIKI